MRLLTIALFACLATAMSGQSLAYPMPKLADQIAISRTIIARLDKAAQNDPPPAVSPAYLVRVHKDAVAYLTLADATSESVRKNGLTSALAMFTLYDGFTELYDEYQLMVYGTQRKTELTAAFTPDLIDAFGESKGRIAGAAYGITAQQDKAAEACLSAKH